MVEYKPQIYSRDPRLPILPNVIGLQLGVFLFCQTTQTVWSETHTPHVHIFIHIWSISNQAHIAVDVADTQAWWISYILIAGKTPIFPMSSPWQGKMASRSGISGLYQWYNLTIHRHHILITYNVNVQGLWCIQTSIVLHRPTPVFCMATCVASTHICNTQSCGRLASAHVSRCTLMKSECTIRDTQKLSSFVAWPCKIFSFTGAQSTSLWEPNIMSVTTFTAWFNKQNWFLRMDVKNHHKMILQVLMNFRPCYEFHCNSKTNWSTYQL